MFAQLCHHEGMCKNAEKLRREKENRNILNWGRERCIYNPLVPSQFITCEKCFTWFEPDYSLLAVITISSLLLEELQL